MFKQGCAAGRWGSSGDVCLLSDTVLIMQQTDAQQQVLLHAIRARCMLSDHRGATYTLPGAVQAGCGEHGHAAGW